MALELIWTQDSGGMTTVHRNGKNLTYKESYLGRVVCREGEWYAEIGDFDQEPREKLGPFGPSLTRARMELTARLLEIG